MVIPFGTCHAFSRGLRERRLSRDTYSSARPARACRCVADCDRGVFLDWSFASLSWRALADRCNRRMDSRDSVALDRPVSATSMKPRVRCVCRRTGASLREKMERATGVEPATSSLGSWHSTTELRPPAVKFRVAASECQIRKGHETRGAATTKRTARGSADKRQTSGASSLDPHLYPPPRHGGGNRK